MRIPMMAMTTSNSTNVNAARDVRCMARTPGEEFPWTSLILNWRGGVGKLGSGNPAACVWPGAPSRQSGAMTLHGTDRYRPLEYPWLARGRASPGETSMHYNHIRLLAFMLALSAVAA